MRTHLFATVILLTGVAGLRGQALEVAPLPKISIETSIVANGAVVKSETKDFLGTLQLPWPGKTALPGERPPFGHREETHQESIAVLGKELVTTRIDWVLKNPDEFANHDAQRITFWVADRVKTPGFTFPMPHGPGLPLPAGTVQFEQIPREKAYAGDPGGKRKTTVLGKLTAEKEVALGSKRIVVYVFAAETKTIQETTQTELWLAPDIPGNFYSVNFKKTGPMSVTLRMQVKAIGIETVADNLHQVAAGEFAVAIPKGWKETKPQGREEMLRLIPEPADEALHRAIVVEMKPAAGKTTQQWAKTLCDDKTHALSFSSATTLGDRPTFTTHRWRGSAARTSSYMIGGIHGDRLYVVSHWQDRAEEKAYAGSEAVDQLVKSWRWMRRKGE